MELATQAILSYKPNINVLALSNYDERAIINSFQKAGVKGCVTKNIEIDDLIKVITSILNGGEYYSHEIAKRMDGENKTPSGEKLSEKEFIILEFINQGFTSQQIADKLFLSKHAINKYRRQLLRKLQVKNAIHLLSQGKKLKLID